MRYIGVVKWYNHEKGYGCIQRAEGDDVMVFRRNLVSTGQFFMDEGASVSFELQEGPEGRVVKAVRPHTTS